MIWKIMFNIKKTYRIDLEMLIRSSKTVNRKSVHRLTCCVASFQNETDIGSRAVRPYDLIFGWWKSINIIVL
ncbi:hypothetical protein QE441_000029 [Chryseobacterium sp. SORGH_AS909]|uniref:Uncharacterized protein n=1 Tax=Chryseobacterium camelliae TaxID=1265445 RepID=A0ABU0TIG3_9FLAO|nr:hypothetical protein [Chryseobacterium camelliae]MDQ1100792.1 hypothetical protein [Chryseobacterium sp. SORGH_AS_1048]MDR6084235.1 hypothetical protein [Chryseobacterium sp. SORGH_AS_0909]MDR6132507.1 hypothetical protein [Chryseobacterium sp. SORGH_AS_1175]MDT3409286.1 hypothetical protein [Pseudacidovorax intermedius]